MNPMLNMMMNMLQGRNPQAFNMLNQAMKGGTNPQDMLKQVMGNSTPQQREQILTQAKGMGVPDNVLSQIQNMK